MTSATANYPKLIVLDDQNRPIVAETRHRVALLAAEHVRYHWSAEEVRDNHPDLKVEQINAALAYFYDHRQEVEQEIAEIEREWSHGRAMSVQPSKHDLKARVKP